MSGSINNRKCIVGPSHIVRWQHLFKNVLTQLPCFDSYAIGGLPIWDDELLSFLKDSGHKYDEIYVLVGDFRFGNGFFNKQLKRYLGISKDNINNTNDSILLDKSLLALDQISELPNVKLVFWDLYLREFINKKSEKYTNNGEYNHPLWNYDFIQNRYSDNTITLSELDKLNLEYLYIDSSLHPSIFGYNFLFNIFTGQSVIDSFVASLKMKYDIDKKLHCPTPTVITGNSTFFRTVNLYIAKGIISGSLNFQLSRADDALFTKRKDDRRIIVFSESKNEPEQTKIKVYVEKSNWKEKMHYELSNIKHLVPSELASEITNDIPCFLFVYAVLQHSLKTDSLDDFDIYTYKESLNRTFIRNCLCLS
ncbi:MAG: hypothetical protein ACRDD5_18395 [Silvania sp.]|uniref:hypothetical protein n=1 Tax=Silvania sp. TaxID=3016633 RepID=UPI003EE6C16B